MEAEKFEALIRVIKADKPYEHLTRGYDLTVDQYKTLETEVKLNTMRRIEILVEAQNVFLRASYERIKREMVHS